MGLKLYKDDCPDQRVIVIAMVILILCVILFSGCKSTRQVQASNIELVQDFEIKQDSVHHHWEVHRVTLYDSGQVSKVEEEERHTQQIVTKILRDTTYIHVRDTLYLYKDAVPAVQATKDVKWSIWGVVIVVGIVFAALLVWRYGRNILSP